MLAAAALVTVVVVLGTLIVQTSDSGEDDSICITTGLPSNIGCVAQPPQQEEINQLAAAAESVTWQVEDLASDAPAGSPVARAASRAEEANRQAQQAARDAQTIMMEALGNDPDPHAFDKLLDSAKTALIEAGQALADAENASQ